MEPPMPLKIRLYRCDKAFVIEPLEQMLESDEIYGLVVMDKREVTIGLLKGKVIQRIEHDKSAVPGKFKAGGQSSWRFMQNRELMARDFYKKIAEMMKTHFLNRENLKGILVGGPGPTKYELVDSGFITGDVQKMVLAVKDIGYTDESGLQELVDKSQDVLAESEIAEEKKIVSNFLELLAKDAAMVAYGKEDVRKAVEAGAVDMLMLSEALDEKVIEEFEALAQKFGTDVRIISTDTREGVQLRDLGKVAAILRYRLE
jgi:peptide chain release factor subunit 1